MQQRLLDRLDKRYLAYFAYIIIDETLWVSNARFNGIYAIDLVTGKSEFKGRIPFYPDEFVGMHAYVKRQEQYLIFFPQQGKSVDIYDMETGNIQSYPIKEWAGTSNHYCVAGIVQREDVFWMFPRFTNKPLITFSLKQRKFERISELKQMNELALDNNKNLAISFIEKEKKGYFPIYDSNCIAEINIEDMTERVYVLENDVAIQTIRYDGEDFWIGSDTSLLQWNEKSGILQCYSNLIDRFENRKNLIADIVCFDKYIYILPQWLGKIKRINKCTQEIEEYEVILDDYHLVKDAMLNWRDIREGYVRGGELIINPINRNKEVHLNLKTGAITGKAYLADFSSMPSEKWGDGKIYYEVNHLLEDYLNLVKNTDSEGNSDSLDIEETVGYAIHHKIMKDIME